MVGVPRAGRAVSVVLVLGLLGASRARAQAPADEAGEPARPHLVILDAAPSDEGTTSAHGASTDATGAADGAPGDAAGADRTERATATARGSSTRPYRRTPPGPRRVPVPHGASRARAERLGLGTREVGSALLHRAPEARWSAAAGTRPPRTLKWPVDVGALGRGFGFVRHDHPEVRHNGVDVATPRGMVIRAAADGIVAYSDNTVDGYGNCVMLVHANGWVTLYAHADRITVQPGYRVRRGERIGFVGSTGRSQGPHLHFELHVDGHAVNPLPYFDGEPWVEGRVALARLRRDHGGHSHAHLGAIEADFGFESERTTAAATREPVHASTTRTARVEPPADPTLATFERLQREGASRADRAPLRALRASRLVAPIRLESEPSYDDGVLTYRVPLATNVRAVAPGLVVYVGRGPRGAVPTTVAVLHENGMLSVYSAEMDVTVAVGATVAEGDRLGIVRSSAGLAFELHRRGARLDPRTLFVVPETLVASAD